MVRVLGHNRYARAAVRNLHVGLAECVVALRLDMRRDIDARLRPGHDRHRAVMRIDRHAAVRRQRQSFVNVARRGSGGKGEEGENESKGTSHRYLLVLSVITYWDAKS